MVYLAGSSLGAGEFRGVARLGLGRRRVTTLSVAGLILPALALGSGERAVAVSAHGTGSVEISSTAGETPSSTQQNSAPLVPALAGQATVSRAQQTVPQNPPPPS